MFNFICGYPLACWEPGPDMTQRYADALIDIAAAFQHHDYCDTGGRREWTICAVCGEDMESDCGALCPGLLARRALGVA